MLEEIDDKIYKIPDLPKLELEDGLANILGAEAKDILEENFVNPKKLEDKTLQKIKQAYGFEEIKMPLMQPLFQNNLNFSMVVTMKTLFVQVTFCHLIKIIINLFISFAQITDKKS